MKFLVTTTVRFPMPPEVAPRIMEALGAWAGKYSANGKMEAVWANAGQDGGGGILNVESLEELDAIMTEFPAAPFSDIVIVPITELEGSLKRTRAMFEAMAGS